MSLNRWRSSLVILLTLAGVSTAFAQIRSATITGAVTDPSRAVIPGATVIVVNQDTNSRTELVTNDAGLFTAPYLPAGTYSIEVSLPGFATFRRSGIVVATAETVRINVDLTVSKVGETVEVAAEAPILQTDRTRTYLKYNPDAFAGRVVTTPNGSVVADQFWYGDAAITYDEFRTDNRFNIDLSIRRTFDITNGVQLEFGADAMNVLNHTQFSGSYTGALGGTVTAPNPALGLVPGMGNSNSYGTKGMNTFNPRQLQLRTSLRF